VAPEELPSLLPSLPNATRAAGNSTEDTEKWRVTISEFHPEGD
jgi:hypothetical protein